MKHTTEPEVTPQGERPDEPSAIPKDYTPDPYPGWRWSATTGEARVVKSLEDEAAARDEGYTERVPPTVTAGPVVPEPPTPKVPEPKEPEPEHRRRYGHTGD
jgi:hypothetical protein